jgi:DNA polymerase-3 subunit alpha
MPKEHGISLTLAEAKEAVPEVAMFATENPALWQHALNLEGVMRNLGRHAAGTVVAGGALVERAVVENRQGAPVVNWDKRIVEDMGLIKMDILGLSTLDTLQIALQYIKERRGIDIDLLQLPLDDAATLDAFGKGQTTGVFQFESKGMKQLLMSLASNRPLTFDELTAATALYRPGPIDSGLLDQYVQVRQGYSVPYYEHPSMERALKETYGVIVYQEQVMKVAQDLCGFSMAEADHLRRAMGKKDAEKMAKMKVRFVEGAKTNSGMDEKTSEQLFEKIQKFAGYAFNKSHSVEYSIVSYWACYLRTHYAAEYFAASLSILSDDKYSGVVRDAMDAGISVLPPQINYSSDRFMVKDDSTIVAPFSAVKFISEIIARKIVALRESNGGKFTSKSEFEGLAARVGSGVNIRAVGNLDKVGAFADIEPSEPLAMDSCRRKDQKELMGDLIVGVVKQTKSTVITKEVVVGVRGVLNEIESCKDCNLCGSVHCKPSMGKKEIKFMVISDCPSFEEEKAGKFLVGKVGTAIKHLIEENGLDVNNGYYTGLVKAKKNDKFLSAEQIAKCFRHIEKEIEVIRPGVIIALGSSSVKRFIGETYSAAEASGNDYYNEKYQATVIGGVNPTQILFDSSKTEELKKTFARVKEVLS